MTFGETKKVKTASTRWTNKSVMAFAKGLDPVRLVERKTRDLVLHAVEQGWSGPPFDPIRLADILKIEIAPRDDIRDARTVSVGTKGARIEFNPNRSRGRVRFSIAHEIVHTLFPDFAERVRNREAHSALIGDEWQLELLCNIGASEIIMPIGSFQELKGRALTIDHLMEERKKHDVSVEAVLIRAVKLTEHPCAMFCASRMEEGQFSGRYRLDYAIPSTTWARSLPTMKYIPKDSVVRQCTAIGYTAKGKEAWGEGSETIAVECVGIPPYPGARYPRVAGLLQEVRSRKESVAPGILFLRGDALAPRGGGNKVIAHIVNDKTAN